MGKHILVIDDDPILRSALRNILENMDCRVTEAANGEQGLKQFLSEAPDLVITDKLMPEKEGFETIVDIRREDPRAKIVAISGGGATRNMLYLEVAKKLGVDLTLEKPIRSEDLAPIVRGL